jgi:hypothetical protein
VERSGGAPGFWRRDDRLDPASSETIAELQYQKAAQKGDYREQSVGHNRVANLFGPIQELMGHNAHTCTHWRQYILFEFWAQLALLGVEQYRREPPQMTSAASCLLESIFGRQIPERRSAAPIASKDPDNRLSASVGTSSDRSRDILSHG